MQSQDQIFSLFSGLVSAIRGTLVTEHTSPQTSIVIMNMDTKSSSPKAHEFHSQIDLYVLTITLLYFYIQL